MVSFLFPGVIQDVFVFTKLLGGFLGTSLAALVNGNQAHADKK